MLGVIFVAVVLFLPTGLTGLWARLFPPGAGKAPPEDGLEAGGAGSATAAVPAEAAP